ncbi:MAG: rod shape-determining protein MreC [Cyclobacteriaceae bacterium]|nr:rod shape-determining protein MreC [Cyclobacteriaceae bacterium]
MLRLLNFLYNYRAFLTFLFLEILCAWLWVGNSQYQNTRFFNSANRTVASIIRFSEGVREYVSLRDVNRELAEENAGLRTLVEQLTAQTDLLTTTPDTVLHFDYVSARVINNSVAQFKNHITINRGMDMGLAPGMAVISTSGAVGKVKSVSEHFAVVTSLLNTDEQVSSVLKRTGNFGTAQWDGTDPRMINLLYIPRHVQPQPGDTVVTSGYNAVFPEGILVGIVREVDLKKEAQFYDVRVELAQDFRRLAYVKVVKSYLKGELDSLERVTLGNQP